MLLHVPAACCASCTSRTVWCTCPGSHKHRQLLWLLLLLLLLMRTQWALTFRGSRKLPSSSSINRNSH